MLNRYESHSHDRDQGEKDCRENQVPTGLSPEELQRLYEEYARRCPGKESGSKGFQGPLQQEPGKHEGWIDVPDIW